MPITFDCSRCGSEFTVADELAGRTGRCKKCGARVVIPQAGAKRELVGAGAVLGSMAKASEQVRKAPQAGQRSSRPTPTIHPRSMNWMQAVASQVALKPISIEQLPALRRKTKVDKDLEEFEDSTPYRMAKSIPSIEPPKKSAAPPGLIKTEYRETFRKLAKIFRRINEMAYGISIFFMMLACVGFCLQMYESGNRGTPTNETATQALRRNEMQTEMAKSMPKVKAPPKPVHQHRLTTIGIAGVVVLNLIRLVAGLANLIVIPFRKSPIEGVKFLIPIFTPFYIKKHWKKMEKPVKRIIGPIFALGIVVLAYAFVPGLSQAGRATGSVGERLEKAAGVLRKDVKREVDEAQQKAESAKRRVEQKLPGELDKAKDAFDDAQQKIKKAVDDKLAPKDDVGKK